MTFLQLDFHPLKGRISRFFSILAVVMLLLPLSMKVYAQSGAALYSGAGSQYGSIGSGASLYSSHSVAQPVLSSGGQLSPDTTLVAQSLGSSSVYGGSVYGNSGYTPTPIPGIATPSVSAPPAVSNTSPIYLQPIDPYAIPNGSSNFFMGSPIGSQQQVTGYNSNPQKIYSGNAEKFFPETYDAMRRFREATSVEVTFIPKSNKDDSFGLVELDLRMQLAFPCRFIPNNGAGRTGSGYFYVAPGGSLVWWNGPSDMPGRPSMGSSGFSAFLDIGAQPQFNDSFALDAWFRIGVFSDFKKLHSDSIRYQGRVMGLYSVSSQFKIVLGVQYLHRARVKLIPTGGVVWTPREDLILRLTFPNPKISKRFWNTGNCDWWAYVVGDYGGGSWSIDGLGRTDYNDIRIGGGVEFETISRVSGYFELGGAFNRELYSGGQAWCKPPNAFYLKAGIVF